MVYVNCQELYLCTDDPKHRLERLLEQRNSQLPNMDPTFATANDYVFYDLKRKVLYPGSTSFPQKHLKAGSSYLVVGYKGAEGSVLEDILWEWVESPDWKAHDGEAVVNGRYGGAVADQKPLSGSK